MGFSKQEYWNGLPFPSTGDLPDPAIKPVSPASSAWRGDSSPLCRMGSPLDLSELGGKEHGLHDLDRRALFQQDGVNSYLF